MAGPAPSNESTLRRSLRFALGVSVAFIIAQFIGWPLAHIAPVFATILLLDATPQPVRQGVIIFATAAAALFGGFLMAFFLLPYLAVTVLLCCVVVYRLYLFMLLSGAHLLALIGVIIGALIMPVLVQLLPEVAVIAGYGLLIDIGVAILVAWGAFFVIPARDVPPASGHGTPSYAEAASIAATITVVATPLLVGFLIFGWSDILVLIYAALFATALSGEGGAAKGWISMMANLVYGGVGMLLVYEILVMAPNLLLMILLIFTVCIFYASRIFGGGPSAGIWASGFFGFLILLGGALLSGEVVAPAKLFDRVFQIFLATAYVAFAYGVIDLIKSFCSVMSFDHAAKEREH